MQYREILHTNTRIGRLKIGVANRDSFGVDADKRQTLQSIRATRIPVIPVLILSCINKK